MLAALEGRLTAAVADALRPRLATVVHRTPGPGQPLAEGTGLVLVGVAEVTTDGGFGAALQPFGDADAARRRRVLPVDFALHLDFTARGEQADPAGARVRLLDDMTVVAHALDSADVRSGAALAGAGADPGFLVHSLVLARGSVERGAIGASVTGRLEFRGRADVWPPVAPEEGGPIRAVDPVMVALPLAIDADDAVVGAGGTTRVRVRGFAASRLVAPGGGRAPGRLAVSIASDLPPAERGTIDSGEPGGETGLRLVPTIQPETVLTYRAPAAVGGLRVEFIAVHLAEEGGGRGALLGSVPIRLRGGA
jgi:hypothetical protein